MKYLLFFILCSTSCFAFDILDPLDFKILVLRSNQGQTLGEMDSYLEHDQCAIHIDLKKKMVSYFSHGRLKLPIREIEFKEFLANPISKSLIWSKTWPLPLMHDRMILYFNDYNKLNKVVTYQYSSWGPSRTFTCHFSE